MAEKTITIYTPCCGQKFMLFYQEEEQQQQPKPQPEPEPAPQRKRASRFLPDEQLTEKQLKKREYQRRWFQKKQDEKEKENRIMRGGRPVLTPEERKIRAAERKRKYYLKMKANGKGQIIKDQQRKQYEKYKQKPANGELKHKEPQENTMTGAIHKFLAKHSDQYFKVSEISALGGIPYKAVTSRILQLIQRDLLVRRESETGQWEYKIK